MLTGFFLTGLTSCQSINVQPSSSPTSSQEQSPITQAGNAAGEALGAMNKKIENASASAYGLGEAVTTNTTATGAYLDPEGHTVASGFKYSKEKDPQGKETQYPMHTILRITNPANGLSVNVEVNDKGNFGSGSGDEGFNKNVLLDMTPGVRKALGLPVDGIVHGLTVETLK